MVISTSITFEKQRRPSAFHLCLLFSILASLWLTTEGRDWATSVRKNESYALTIAWDDGNSLTNHTGLIVRLTNTSSSSKWVIFWPEAFLGEFCFRPEGQWSKRFQDKRYQAILQHSGYPWPHSNLAPGESLQWKILTEDLVEICNHLRKPEAGEMETAPVFERMVTPGSEVWCELKGILPLIVSGDAVIEPCLRSNRLRVSP